MKSINYGKQDITKEDIEGVISVLKSDYLTQGPKVNEFEIKFAEYVDAKYAVAVSNATAGLHLSVMALDLKPNERVITSPITFAASANCIEFSRGEVWFSDIDPNTFLMDLNLVRELIESKPKGFFTGIIPVNFAGLPVDLEILRKIANEFDLWIIEDAAHSPGGYFIDSKDKIQKSGNGLYADLSVFSFHPVKHLACGEGGMITTNSKKLYDRLISLRTHGIKKDTESSLHHGWSYDMTELGYNYRLTDIQASLGITQLLKNPRGVKRRNQIAEKYIKAFKGKLKYQFVPKNTNHAYHLFIIQTELRKELYNFLKSLKINTQVHYIPVHTFTYYFRKGFKPGDFPISESYYQKCLSLPMYPSLTHEDQDFVINSILNFIESR